MNFFKKRYDVITIGDLVADAFIRLKDAHVTCTIDNEKCEICMKYGDKIPYESVEICPAVGNSANAAVSFSRLGLRTAFITDIGDDTNGQEALRSLKNDGIGTDFVRVHKNTKTNYHYVLWYGADRTILIKHETFARRFPSLLPPKWIYLSSLGEDTLPYHDEIAAYLEANPDVKLAFQPGTFQMKFGTEKLARIYRRTDVFFCNKEEAQRILGSDETDIALLIRKIKALGPKMVVVTDGPRGAHASDGISTFFMPPYPDPKPPYERTGAGDAFSSTLTAALALGKSLPEALLWAPINSMSVVQQVGAQKGLLTREALEKLASEAPKDYETIVL